MTSSLLGLRGLAAAGLLGATGAALAQNLGPTAPPAAAYGVSTYPVVPQPTLTQRPLARADAAAPPQSAALPPPAPRPTYRPAPEPGVVVAADGTPYGYGPPGDGYDPPDYAYASPAPVYGADAPPPYGAAYVMPPVYGPPIGLSFSLGYMGGWHRGWR